MNESISDKGDCRTAPATPGLLKTESQGWGGEGCLLLPRLEHIKQREQITGTAYNSGQFSRFIISDAYEKFWSS